MDDITEAVRTAFEGMQAEIWTTLPGIVDSFDLAAGTVRVQPAIQARVFSPTDDAPLPGAVLDKDQWWWVNLPLLIDCPVLFPQGGGFVVTFPIKKGDECVVFFSARSIDDWWYQGGVQKQSILTMHDLSDGFAFFGPRSKPRALAGINANNAEFRSEDGAVKIEITPANVNITATGKVTLNAPEVDISNGGALQKLATEALKTWAGTHTHTSAVAGNPTSTPIQAIPANAVTTVAKAE